MISVDKEEKIRKLLSEGVKLKVITERLGVSRRLVVVISKLSEIRERKGPQGRQKIRRCPTCGGKVYVWPCILCNPQEGCY